MIQLFSGAATLCAVAKEHGMKNSLALDKFRKRGIRSTIFIFDLLQSDDRELLNHWLESGLVCWVHISPGRGTTAHGDSKRLRSEQFPMGLPDLDENQRVRVDIANNLFFSHL